MALYGSLGRPLSRSEVVGLWLNRGRTQQQIMARQMLAIGNKMPLGILETLTESRIAAKLINAQQKAIEKRRS